MTNGDSSTSGFLGGLARTGVYFQLVSIVPASIVVLVTYALLVSGAPSENPKWTSIAESVDEFDFSRATVLAIAIVVLGMMLHPLQFATTQFLEGYWGSSRLGRAAMFSRARIHFARHLQLIRGSARSDAQANRSDAALESAQDAASRRRAELDLLRHTIDAESFKASTLRYPLDHQRLRPTRLGNVLRRYEDLAGSPYGLEAPLLTPHLMALAPPEQVEDVNDARSGLDLAVRFVISWLLLAVVSFLLLWPFGLWLLIPLFAYGFAWLSYWGAVHAAEEYGNALVVLFDLNHQLIQEDFRLPTEEDRARLATINAIAQRLEPD